MGALDLLKSPFQSGQNIYSLVRDSREHQIFARRGNDDEARPGKVLDIDTGTFLDQTNSTDQNVSSANVEIGARIIDQPCRTSGAFEKGAKHL